MKEDPPLFFLKKKYVFIVRREGHHHVYGGQCTTCRCCCFSPSTRGPRDSAQVVRLSGMYLDPLSHLSHKKRGIFKVHS